MLPDQFWKIWFEPGIELVVRPYTACCRTPDHYWEDWRAPPGCPAGRCPALCLSHSQHSYHPCYTCPGTGLVLDYGLVPMTQYLTLVNTCSPWDSFLKKVVGEHEQIFQNNPPELTGTIAKNNCINNIGRDLLKIIHIISES